MTAMPSSISRRGAGRVTEDKAGLPGRWLARTTAASSSMQTTSTGSTRISSVIILGARTGTPGSLTSGRVISLIMTPIRLATAAFDVGRTAYQVPDVDLVNKSDSAITIDSVSGIGQGLNTTMKVVEVKIAPAETGTRARPVAPMRWTRQSPSGRLPRPEACSHWCVFGRLVQ
jgi:hypothetical protein